VGELRFPRAWRQIGDPARRVSSDTLQHIDEVSVGIHTVQPTGHQQAANDSDPLGTDFRLAE
jgi:hypothetical protein